MPPAKDDFALYPFGVEVLLNCSGQRNHPATLQPARYNEADTLRAKTMREKQKTSTISRKSHDAVGPCERVWVLLDL